MSSRLHRRIETREVLGAAYLPTRKAAMLTHAVVVDGDCRPLAVLCRRVRVENIADRNANPSGLNEQPTCGVCLRAWNKHKAKERK